jgi:O-antigen ligase
MAITSIDSAAETRFSGPLGNPIYISIYFLFIFFFTIILWYKDVLLHHLSNWTSLKKVLSNFLFYLYPLIAILSFYAVYRTSRGVLLGLVGGLFVTAILIAILEKEKKVIKQISSGIVVAVIVVIIAFLSARQSTFVKSNPTLSRLAEVSWSNVNGQARQYVWPMAIKGFKEKPILGWGQDGFNYVTVV